MKKAKHSKAMTVLTLDVLAATMGVHRRTLADYAKKGCPIIKSKSGGYLCTPTLSWFGRMMMRRQIVSFLKTTPVPECLEENLNQILEDHEKAWPVFLEQESSP